MSSERVATFTNKINTALLTMKNIILLSALTPLRLRRQPALTSVDAPR